VRYHEDDEDRLQWEDAYRMADGRLALTSAGAPGSQANRVGAAEAWSVYLQDEIRFGAWTVTPGLRYEDIDLVRRDFAGDDPDRSDGPTRVRRSGVQEWIAIGTEAADWTAHARLADANPGTVHWTAGLHPCHVQDDFETELDHLECLFEHLPDGPAPCAIGEIGLDLTKTSKSDRNQVADRQKIAFIRQLVLARRLGLPVVIHSRGAVEECLTILNETGFPPEKTLFHCFAEGPETLRRLRTAGVLCSFTGIPTFRNAANVREALIENGVDNLILETDSPYLSPEPHRGKPNEPARTRIIAEFCADLFSVPLEEIARISTANTRKFFQLISPKEKV